MLRVRYAMSRNVISVSPTDPLSEAYEIMQSENIRHLPVVEGTSLVGILSDRDILLRATREGERIYVSDQEPVYSSMSVRLITCTNETTVAEAARTMIENKINMLPVLDTDGSLIGLITATDLLDLLCQSEEAKSFHGVPLGTHMKGLDRDAGDGDFLLREAASS